MAFVLYNQCSLESSLRVPHSRGMWQSLKMRTRVKIMEEIATSHLDARAVTRNDVLNKILVT